MINEEFLKRIRQYLTTKEYEALVACYQETPTRGLRLNQVEPDIFIEKSGIPVEKIDYDEEGYYVMSDQKLGNHPYHHLGAFYLQEPSAMAPVNLIQFRGDELVLDLCAAPGGKSFQIASRIPNGVLFSNDPSLKRSKVLFGNMERLGFSNVVVLNETPEHLASLFSGLFDVVLVDAPCSGEGMMRKDPTVSEQWKVENTLECQKRDYDIVNAASKMLRQGGKMIYSTCTFEKEENEDVVNYISQQLHYDILVPPSKLRAVTKEGFLPNTLRFYPFTGKGEGQFMTILQKQDFEETVAPYRKEKGKKNSEINIVYDFLKENLNPISLDITKVGNRYYANATDIDLSKLSVLNYGIELGEVSKNRFIPYHHLFKALGSYFKNKLILDINDSRVQHYIHGEEIIADIPNGFGVIEIDGLYLGGFKAVNGHLKNYYPKGLRTMNLVEDKDESMG